MDLISKEQVIKRFVDIFSFSKQDAKEVVEILLERNIPLEKCEQHWDELCFRFESLEEIEIENTDFCSIQDLIDNKEFRENNYILSSGLLVSIG